MANSSIKNPSLFSIGLSKSDVQKASDFNDELIGIKGANLARMANLGLSVPPAFVVSTEVGRKIALGGEAVGSNVADDIRNAIAEIEKTLDRSFGGDERPLLVSVRSGAAVSMPGMMDTVLNLGLNETTVAALARETGDERFAWDSYRRFIQSFAQVVLDLDSDSFEDVLDEMRTRNGVETDAELPAFALKDITTTFQEIVVQETGEAFPQDVFDQLNLALLAVFKSWNTPRANRYRDMHSISHEGGTAAVVQAMVFGNRDEKSCTGVYFTRNPSIGERRPYGEYLPNAQGEDVVSGFRTPLELTEADREAAVSDTQSMEVFLPDAYAKLIETGNVLEQHFKDMQEIEFTVESGHLFLLQTRSGKRTPKAGLRIAVEMVDEGILSKTEAVNSCDMSVVSSMLVSKLQPAAKVSLFTKGLPASPGAAVGQIVFSSDEAVKLQKEGKDCILVRPETDPKDVHGMDAAVGILTTRGGMTSHAAVVARGMGKPCITAAMTLKIDVANQVCSCSGTILKTGNVISIDGGAGTVYRDPQPVVVPEPDGELATLMKWADELGQ